MKGIININISSCTSQDSTAIISSSSNIELPSSSSLSSSSSSSSSGGRAIDRHNPIITDERRSYGLTTPINSPCIHNTLQQKPPSPSPSPRPSPMGIGRKNNNKKKKKLVRLISSSHNNKKKSCSTSINDGDGDDDQGGGRRSYSKPSDLIMRASVCTNTRPGVDCISPPESSRYLLDNNNNNNINKKDDDSDDDSFLNALSNFDPVLKLGRPFDTINKDNNHDVDIPVVKSGAPKPANLPASSSSGSSDQVVVLRVSLHCRGCERKMKKHLSRMAGVTSFNIDFAAKKVTVVGDVTPLGVLASISKVKNAQLWTPPIASSCQINSRKYGKLENNQM